MLYYQTFTPATGTESCLSAPSPGNGVGPLQRKIWTATGKADSVDSEEEGQDLESHRPQGQMGNNKSCPGQECSSRFLPAEQAEVNRLFDALSSEKLGSSASPRSFSLQALKARDHVGDALPPEMVTRLFEGMRRVDGSGKVKGPSERVSQEQFTASMSHLLKGTAEEKSLVILNMISASGGPVKARDVHKFTEDLVGSVVHVLSYRRQLRGWSQKPPPGSPSRVQVLAAQLCSEMRLQGGGKLLGPQWLDRDCDQAVLEDWVFRAHHVATFLSLVIHQGFLLLRSSLKLATLVPERQVDPQREFASVLDVLSVIYVNSHLPQERRLSWRLLFATELHGNSFAQLCGRIAHGGPCLVLLEDSDGHVFGGFASCSWEVKPQFQGHGRTARLLWAVDRRRFRERTQQGQAHVHHVRQPSAVGPGGLPVPEDGGVGGGRGPKGRVGQENQEHSGHRP
ncbi:TLD domain-containing protein 1 isoform X5 [Bos indicus x Bos taurus]|uniref:TLD domain-containing protein 1 isoform X5 n=1 Tax=Bos indicus x Bos taurus TaxID=30522 RepID=UPI000F7D3B95|nr:TLD domain-containing protein 1 isoform X5 [Bos indicus x Bos taurus]